MTVLVTGPTGFLGRRVVKALVDQGTSVRCLVHKPGSEKIIDHDLVDVHYGSVTDPASLRSAFYDLEAVVHLVAVIREIGMDTFYRINVRGVQNVIRAASDAGIERFVHVSAIGAQDNAYMKYLHSRWRAERLIKQSGLSYTILRSSLMFGEGDEFINTLAGLIKCSPIVPVIGSGLAQFQPISVEDVARCIVSSINQENMKNRQVELGGPTRLTYDQIADIVIKSMRARRTKIHLPVSMFKYVVWLLETIRSRPPVTRDQLSMLTVPNFPSSDSVQEMFGFKPRPLVGNIDFVNRISRFDGLRISLGNMPSNIRDH